MNLPELMTWHRAELATATDPAARLAHEDAIALLAWCVELPASGPSEFAREFALETMLDHTAAEMRTAKARGVNVRDPELLEDVDQEVRFWRLLNANVADQMGAQASCASPPRLRIV